MVFVNDLVNARIESGKTKSKKRVVNKVFLCLGEFAFAV